MAERERERRRSIIVSCIALFTVCAGGLIAMVIELPILGVPASTAPKDLRTIRITTDSIDGSCRQQTLDNQTWRVSGAHEPCDTAAPRDANKSFSGK